MFRLAAMGALGTLALLAGCASSDSAKPPTEVAASLTPAPAFELAAADGKVHSLKSLTAKGPVFFYAIKDGCPVNARAEDFYDQLARAYAGKVTFVGVSNLTAETFPRWNESFGPSYPVLLDSKKELIRGLDMKRSPWLVQVDQKGNVVKSWSGYSTADLEDMSEAMAAAGGVKPAQLDFSAAPERTSYG